MLEHFVVVFVVVDASMQINSSVLRDWPNGTTLITLQLQTNQIKVNK